MLSCGPAGTMLAATIATQLARCVAYNYTHPSTLLIYSLSN